MKVYYSFIDKFSTTFSFPCIFSLGIFDGVHTGHMKIIKNMISIKSKSKKKYKTVLITFYPHPKEVISPKKRFFYLNTLSERIENLKKTKIENLVIYKFNKSFSKLGTEDFIRKILYYIYIKKMIVGYDFHMGKNRNGSYQDMKKLSNDYGFELHKINYPFKIEGKIVSSTNIRNSLIKGDLRWANKALGYYYKISGYVIKGKGLGRKLIKFPTANLKISCNKLIPRIGVYAVKVIYNNEIFNGMLNIGINPTINSISFNNLNKKIKIEVHIFNFFYNIYGIKIDLSIIKFIREEIKFSNIEKLRNQIKQDKIVIENFFKKNKIIEK